ncbi:sigma-70 family RNA polymerase sigma factor [Stenotrophomonas sp. MMGLT7]|uniref:RNA polymerase sigma factor n=1 Tax=Stenotrophomonas sp. MMGLT7 TaxID=2901227 RepID=UPI001E484024|nr:sigma-70 family RNA polymerase sigma factor [Stenotrophomonas sp. MMGLT7]MCD7100144.1 sigma-70 family RNA polymerase sigma factor [Stenotrophomonas sp. MMGLT7]
MKADTLELMLQRELPAASGGCTQAYGRIVAACQNTVTAIALAITRDVHASEDIAQDAFLKAWQQLGRLNNTASFLPWLRQITRNLARDWLRAQRGRPLSGEAAEIAIGMAADPSPSPADQLLQVEEEAAAAEIISALPEDSRETLLLYYREGQSSQQVAALLGLSDAAVRKRLSRARGSVREELLRRFGEFARSSAPGAGFAVVVTTAAGIFSKPAAATGLGMAGGSLAGGIAGKLGAGTGAAGALGGLLGGIGGGMLAYYLCRMVLFRYTENEAERRRLTASYHRYMRRSFIGVGAIVATLWLCDSHWPALAAMAVTMAIVNYEMIVPLRRVMKPLLERDRLRDPRTALRRQLGYHLTFGPAAIVISNAAVLAAVLPALHAPG